MSSGTWSADTEEIPSGRRAGQLVAGKYRLVRLIGQGGMGEVYEAQHAVVGRRFAVKFLHPYLAQSSSALLRFRREAQAAGALENEHIAAVTDFDTADDGAPFLVMEYLVGESLGRLLAREGPLPLSRVVGALLQVCRGLTAAHAAGIVHRDLKPDNLFLVRRADGSDLLKILDFGIAKLNRADSAVDLTRSGAMLGTPFYMAPEQARGEKQVGERADIYALGVIVYELLSGHKPHPGDSYNSILAHILSQPVAPLASLRPGLPNGFAQLVERALSSSPDDRPASAAAFAAELLPFVGRELLPTHSHFDLRAPVVGAVTLTTPDAHTVSVAHDEPSRRAPSARSVKSELSPPAEPAREGPARARRALVVFAPVLALVAAGVWAASPSDSAPASSTRAATIPPPTASASASAVPAAAPVLVAASVPAAGTATSTAAPTSAGAVTASASASASAPVPSLASAPQPRPLQRQPSRPRPARNSAPAPAPLAGPPKSAPVAASQTTPAPAPATRVNIDEKNPY